MNTENDPNPFPLQHLPPVLHGPVRHVAEVFGIPIALPATAALGCVSAAIGKGLWLQHPVHGATPGNLYILVIARSGGFKTTTLKYFSRPIAAYEEDLKKDFTTQKLPAMKAELAMVQGKIKGAGGDRENPAFSQAELAELYRREQELKELMTPPRLLFENTTTEALGIGLSRNGGCGASISDDARGVISNVMGLYRKGHNTDEDLYLKLYSVSDTRIDRASRPALELSQAALSIYWMVQPDKFSDLEKSRSINESGFLPRFLLAAINTGQSPIVSEFRGISEVQFHSYNALLKELLTEYRMLSERAIVPASQAAVEHLAAYNAFFSELQKKCPRDYLLFADRWSENLWRIALVLHAATHGKTAAQVELSPATVDAAFGIFNWFREEQSAVLEDWRQNAAKKQVDAFLAYLRTKGPSSVRQIVQSRRFGNSAEVRILARQVFERGLIHESPQDTWAILPAALQNLQQPPTSPTRTLGGST